jgi:leucyl aminopeptidase
VATISIVGADDPATLAALRRASVIAQAVTVIRDQVNLAPAELYPESFAQLAADAAVQAGCTVEVLDEAALLEGGFGGLMGVGGGAARPPRLVKISYRPPQPKAKVALVGKGITFDSGGYNLKVPAPVNMKCDMAGAATVLAAVVAAAQLELPIEVTAYGALAQNMISSTAYLPSDVLTIRGGKTVEVANTDAEGRLVLADAIVRAAEDGPDYLVETSTLTGAQLVALGPQTAGVMGSTELRERIVRVAATAGESMWPMPLLPELRPGLDSPVADLRNVTTDRMGGMIVAGLFLAEFVPDGMPWVHIDVAGPAWNDGSERGYTPKGGTGYGLRSIIALLEDLSTEDR